MKRIAALFLISTPLVAATVPLPLELKFPAGTGALSPGSQGVAMNDSYILVGFHHADVKSASGKVIPGAGEVQVFSARTGQFLRRLKHPQAATGQKFGSRVVLCGDQAIVLDLNSRVNAFSAASGKFLWSYHPKEDVDSFTLYDSIVDHLSADAGSVKLGMSTAWWIDYPVIGFFKSQGFVAQASATGVKGPMLYEGNGQAFGGFGFSTAVAGNMTIVGSANHDSAGQEDSGLVTVFDGSTMIGHLLPPTSFADDEFGFAVAVTRDRIIVGARGFDQPGKGNAGRVYLYDKTSFALVGHIDAPAAVPASGLFGMTLVAHGSRLVIGAIGSIWSYDLCTGELLELPKPAGAASTFGNSVAVCSHAAVVADSQAAGGTASIGRVHLYPQLSRTLPASAVIASTKQAAPGCPTGTVFADFGSTATTATGKVLHTATLAGTSNTSATNAGVWSNQAMGHALLLRKGDVMGNLNITTPFQPFFASDGTGRFSARSAVTQKLSVFRDTGSSIVPLISEGGSLIVNGKTETIAKINDVSGSTEASSLITVAASSLAGTGGVTPANDSHISRHISISLVAEAREGFPSAFNNLHLGQITPRIAVEAGRLAYVARLAAAPAATDTALFVKNLGINNTRAMAVKGDLAPGAGNARFNTFASTAINGTETVFRATLKGGASGVTSGLWRTTLINNNQQVATYPVAIRLQQAGGMPAGVKFSRFMEIFIAEAGGILFRAQVTGPGITPANDLGVWLHSQGINHLLVREGAHVQGANGPKVGTLQRVAMARDGRFALLVSLTGAPSTANQALLSGNFLSVHPCKWTPSLVLQKGQYIDRPAATPLRSLSIAANHLDPSGSGSKGQAHQVSVHGLVFVAGYTGGKDLLMLHP